MNTAPEVSTPPNEFTHVMSLLSQIYHNSVLPQQQALINGTAVTTPACCKKKDTTKTK